MSRVLTNRAAPVRKRSGFPDESRFLTGAALKNGSRSLSWGEKLRRIGLSVEETLQDHLSGNAVLAGLAFFLRQPRLSEQFVGGD